MRSSPLKQKQKDLLTLFVVLIAIALFSAMGIYFRSSNENSTEEKKEEPVVIEGKLPENNGTSTGKQQGGEKKQIGSQAYFLKPSAGEVLSAIRGADPLTKPPEDAPPMKVMWPGYFFQTSRDSDGNTIVQLDIDENGFGVILICTVNINEYPEVQTLEPGKQIWVAGEVTAIDPEGTGQVFINVEFIRFDEGPPAAAHD